MLRKKTELFLQTLGKPLVGFILNLGYFSRFVAKSIYNCFVPPFYIKLFSKQFMNMGFILCRLLG